MIIWRPIQWLAELVFLYAAQTRVLIFNLLCYVLTSQAGCLFFVLTLFIYFLPAYAFSFI